MKYLTITIAYEDDDTLPFFDFNNELHEGTLVNVQHDIAIEEDAPDLFEAMGLKPARFNS